MLVVLSDLHFSEAQSTQIGSVKFNRNLQPEAYRSYFSEINQIAKANHVNRVDLVLAGDIFEISRSSIWLKRGYRPYINNQDVVPGSDIEKTILEILQAIAEEDRVSETLILFQNIHHYFEVDVQAHLILGNHDRLANATQRIREKVRKMIGIEGGIGEIKNYLVMQEDNGKPFCLIRHGHEYDPINFSWDVREMDSIPVDIPRDVYNKACLGDITTIEFGAALPWLFEKKHGGEAIQKDETLMSLYQRLMEFDDVRPTTAWLAYLFSTPGVKKRITWQLVKPAFTSIVNTLSDHDEFNKTLKQSAAISPLIRTLLIGALRLGLFKRGVPYWLIKKIMKRVSTSIKLKSQVKWVKREALIQDKKLSCRCVISGHTHFAEVSLISAKKGNERYYINTGTWRNIIPATNNFKGFGRLNVLTKVIVFYPNEKRSSIGKKDWAFQYLSGASFGQHLLL